MGSCRSRPIVWLFLGLPGCTSAVDASPAALGAEEETSRTSDALVGSAGAVAEPSVVASELLGQADEVVGTRWDWTLGKAQYDWLARTLHERFAGFDARIDEATPLWFLARSMVRA